MTPSCSTVIRSRCPARPRSRCRGVCRRFRDRHGLDDESQRDGHRDHWTVGARRSAIDQLERNEAARNDRQRRQRSRDGPPGGSVVGFVRRRQRAALRSSRPAIVLPSDGNLTLTFSYYLAHTSNSSTADYLRVTIVGATTRGGLAGARRSQRRRRGLGGGQRQPERVRRPDDTDPHRGGRRGSREPSWRPAIDDVRIVASNRSRFGPCAEAGRPAYTV